MPVKSVREMSPLERMHYSLGAHVFHATLNVFILTGIVSLVVGLGLYSLALIDKYVGESFGLARSTSLVVNEIIDVEQLSSEVMSVYRGLSEEQRKNPDDEAYLRQFEHISKTEGYPYLLEVLNTFKNSAGVFDLYLAVFDRETGAMVYLADPEERDEYACPPGYWESVKEKELEKFLTWDGTGSLYDISTTDKYGWMCTAGVPFRNESGEMVCFILADVTLDGVAARMKAFAIQYLIAIVLIQLVSAVMMVRHMKKTVVKPINDIALAAQNYLRDKQNGTDKTDHFSSLNIRTGDEIENLNLVMADMEQGLTEFEESLKKITSEKERIATELSLATRIQADMLPNIYPPFPDRGEFDIYASTNPAKEVGGDFYNYFLTDDDHLCMIIADVSGKGIPAALFMMASMIILTNNAMSGKSPAQILTDANNTICANNREEMFVTVWIGILELSTGTLTAGNAGHEYPALMDEDGQFKLYTDHHNLVIGAFSGIEYKEYTISLKPGSKLFLYTDGVPEARNADQQFFGTKRMMEALNTKTDVPPEEIVRNVWNVVAAFVNDAEQFDDLTMLSLEYRGQEGMRNKT